MPVFQQFPLGCAIRKRAFRVTMETLGCLALHRELQTKLPPLPVSRPDGAQAGCDTPSTHCRTFPGLLGKGLHGCGSRKRANRDLWPDHMGHRALVSCSVQAQSCPQLPAEEGSAEPAASCGHPGPGSAWVASARPSSPVLILPREL